MRISYRQLSLLIGQELALPNLIEKLTMLGLEVENVIDIGVGSGKVLVGEIKDIKPHPNADSLVVAQVNVGQEQPLEIVCGAKNMKPGDWVPVAMIGAQLPGGITIKKSAIRGQTSYGMMCSGREIGWGEDSQGLLILPREAPYQIGAPFDAILDLKVTPNRPDWLSIYGVARDLAAALGRTVAPPDAGVEEKGSAAAEAARVTVEAPAACPRYLARVIRSVRIGPSPLWLQRAVEVAGMRSINNVVDITNYVLLETGHPLHAFDLDALAGKHIIVRHARAGEMVETLDGQTNEMVQSDLLIADKEKPVALAGIMGCGNSEITGETRDVLLECAYFDPAVIRRTSKRLAKQTESSYRFERGTDWQNLPRVIDRAAQLIAETAGGEVAKGIIEVAGQLPTLRQVAVQSERVAEMLGVDLSTDEIREGLVRLGFEPGAAGDGALQVQVPAFRVDIEQESDIAEEVARIVGYDRIPASLPRLQSRAIQPGAEEVAEERIRDTMQRLGFHECATYSFMAQEALARVGAESGAAVSLKNPLSADYAVMRSMLLPSLLEAAAYNHSHGNLDLRLFEIGTAFGRDGEEYLETLEVAAVLTGAATPLSWRTGQRAVDFYDAKAVGEALLSELGFESVSVRRPDAAKGEASVLHPGKSAVLGEGGDALIFIGELHPMIAEQLELKRRAVVLWGEVAPLAAKVRSLPPLSSIPALPGVTRDLALVADAEVSGAQVEEVIRKRTKGLLAGLVLFDVYEGEKIPAGKRSLAYKLSLNASDRTLTDEEVAQLMERVLSDLNAKLGVTLREA